jgi:hypothetical protein
MMDKKITMIMSENQRLLLSWTMDLAGLMRSRYDMEKKAALEKAHLNRNLVMYLGEGVVTFVYEEADGTEREARGTLCKGVSKAFDAWSTKKTEKEEAAIWPRDHFVYWDLDAEAFRSWNASRLLKIKGRSVVNCLHEKQ